MISFSDFIQYLTSEKRFSSHTISAYISDLNQYSDFLERQYSISDASEAKAQMIRSWIITMMDDKLASRSVNRKLSTLKSYYRFLMRDGRIRTNPMAKVTSPKNGSRLPVYVEKNDMDELLDLSMYQDDFSGLRDRLILMLFYYTGMRRSELMGMDLESYDRHSLTLKVLGKGNKERMIPINKELGKLIDSYIIARNGKVESGMRALVVTDGGKKAYPNFIYRTVKDYLSRVSTQQKRSPHVLRHTFATHMLNNGADLNSIKEILGHANLSATQIYTHNSVEKLKSIYEQAHPKA